MISAARARILARRLAGPVQHRPVGHGGGAAAAGADHGDRGDVGVAVADVDVLHRAPRARRRRPGRGWSRGPGRGAAGG